MPVRLLPFIATWTNLDERKAFRFGLNCLSAALFLSVVALGTCSGQDRPAILARVRAAGILRCGIDIELAEYTTTDDYGNRAAFDADLCRAVALAVLGPKAQVARKEFPDDVTAMAALTAGEVDLIPTLADDFTHSAATHLSLTRPILWDGIGFLLPGTSQMARTSQLGGKRICFLAETAVEETTRAWFAQHHLSFVPFPFQEEGEMQAAFLTGNCGALAGERTRLAQTRSALLQHGEQTRLLADSISNDPLAGAVRDNDPQWFQIVSWVYESLIAAEHYGVTRGNAAALAGRAAEDVDPRRRFLLGGSHQIGAALGLDNDWVARVIAATGNYGEIYERDLGISSAMKLPRGANNEYQRGGVMVPLPPR